MKNKQTPSLFLLSEEKYFLKLIKITSIFGRMHPDHKVIG